MGTLRQILELEGPKSVKKSRLIISLPWREFMPPKPDNSVLDIFGEMEFRERKFGIGTPSPSPSPASTPTPVLHPTNLSQSDNEDTEEDEKDEESSHENNELCGRKTCLRCNYGVGSRGFGVGFPAPISSIGRNGKPRVFYQSVKEKGRLVLKEMRIPSQQCMHSFRKNGRLLLHFGNPNDSDG